MKSHILLVEDDDKTRQLLATRIQYAGYHVTQAPDGETAIELLEAETFDVVLTDIVMGDVSGMEVLHTARLQSYAPEVIILTGHGTLDTAIAAVREGACDYLKKPCAADQLLSCIEKATRRHARNEQMRQAVAVMTSALYDTGMLDDQRTPSSHPAPSISSPTHKTSKTLTVGALSIGSTRREVTLHNEPLHVTPIEYALLYYLAEHAEQPCSCSDIVRYTHKLDLEETSACSLIRSHIRNLRKKLPPSSLISDNGGYTLLLV